MKQGHRIVLVTVMVTLLAVAMGAMATSAVAQDVEATGTDEVIQSEGNTAQSTISFSADQNVGTGLVNVSLETAPWAEIVDADNATPPGQASITFEEGTRSNPDLSDGVVNFTYDDAQANFQDVTLGFVEVEWNESNPPQQRSALDVQIDPGQFADGSGNSLSSAGVNAEINFGAQPDIQVTDVEGPSEVNRDSSVTYTVTAENSGNAQGTETVDLDVEGSSVDSESVTLSPGQSTTFDLTWDTTGANVGQTNVSVGGQSITNFGIATPTVRANRNLNQISGGDRVFLGEDTTFNLVGNIGGLQIEDFELDGQEIIDDPVDWTLEEGNYYRNGDDDFADQFIRVREPVPERLRILDQNGQRIGGGTVEEREATGGNAFGEVQIAVDYREGFDRAGLDLEGLVLDDEGGDITAGTVLSESTGDAQAIDGRTYDRVINVSFEDTGTFEVGVEPDDGNNQFDREDNDDYDQDRFAELTTVTVISEDDPTVSLEQSSAFQGERVDYEISNTFEDDASAVTLDASDFREDLEDIRENGNLAAFRTAVGNQFAESFRLRDEGEARGHIFRDTSGVITGNQNDYFFFVQTGNGDAGNVFDTSGNQITGENFNTITAAAFNGNAELTHVFGIVQKSDIAESQLRTEFIDDVSTDLELFEEADASEAEGDFGLPSGTATDTQVQRAAVLNIFNSAQQTNDNLDEESIDVQEAEIEINSPARTYVPGQEVDLNGTTSTGVDEVAVFTRDRDEWFLVETISVDETDDTYEETRFELSADSVSNDADDILGQPGVYRYGVIDIIDAQIAERADSSETVFPPTTGPNAGQSDGLDSSDFSSGASIQQSIRVAEPTLEGDFITFNGQVYQDDGLDFVGTLIGPRDYVSILTDTRGNSVAQTETADRDGTIDETDFGIGGLRSGTANAALVSPGRDQLFGQGSFDLPGGAAAIPGLQSPGADGSAPPSTPSNLVAIAENTDSIFGNSPTQGQVREFLLDQTVDQAGSDDLIFADQFRITTDSRTQIESVVPASLQDNTSGIQPIEVGETAVVEGTTNRNPDDATIVVEATEGPSLAELDVGIADEWNDDREPDGGEWSVELEITEAVEPGNYTIQSDDGERVDEANLEILAEGTAPDRTLNNAEALRQQISELEDEVEFLRGQRDDLNQTVADLEAENSDLQEQIDNMESGDDGETEDDSTDDSTDGNETEDDSEAEEQPGFTAVAALISLIAVALLALRRKEE